jgi:hypothetical protein
LRDAVGAYPEAFFAGAVLQAVAAGIIVLGAKRRTGSPSRQAK